MHKHLHQVYDRKFSAHQAQLWRDAPTLSLHFTYGSVRLAGSVNTELGRQRLLARAREIFGASAVVDTLKLTDREVPADWLDSIVSLLWLAGKKIDNGTIEFGGRRVRVSGTLADPATKNTLADNMQAVLSEYAILEPELTLAPKHAALSAALTRLLPADALQFPARSAVLAPASKRVLNRVAELLRKSMARVEIIGYADAVGAPELSQRLSKLRAEAVRDYLVERGVAAQQLRTLGAGEGATSMAGAGAGAAAAALPNRRAELRVTSP